VVDNKLQTKELALRHNIRVPPLYHVVEIEKHNRELGRVLSNHEDFVLKPAQGCGGDGIWVFDGRHHDRFIRSNGTHITEKEIMHHVSSILSGVYSLGGKSDRAYFEYRVKPHTFFDPISYRGVPDIRVIIFRGIPVLAMLRLPTRASDGKANLHQGALGLGIELTEGFTRGAILNNRHVVTHPDTFASIENLYLPNWPEVLSLAVACDALTALDYIGVDIVIDQTQGPMLLEVNARPGLSIQMCNRIGLKRPLEAIEKLTTIPKDVPSRVALGHSIHSQYGVGSTS
jgi:alpha-L-glutamate ligase-like protein